jgi:NTE family protein
LGPHPPPAESDEVATYLPEPPSKRHGIALCLSGGGFRAALFHLGALRRLNQLGLLGRLETVSAVSGGAIVAAHVATRLRPWPALGAAVPEAVWEATVAAPLRAFAGRNRRTGPLLHRLLPRNWPRPEAAVEALAAGFASDLTPLHLAELPDRPRFLFGATDLAYAVNWVAGKDRVGDYRAGYAAPPPPRWTVARAVAASCCFPPWFAPMPVGIPPDELKGGQERGAERDRLAAELALSDGGLYDNLALEPVWKRAATVLVSDGGATFDFTTAGNPIARLLRYNAIVAKQAVALRKRWLIAGFLERELDGTYWGVGGNVGSYDRAAPDGYGKALVDDVISEVRTDLDAFSPAECAVLENHGYALAEAAIQRHVPELARSESAPFALPHPGWTEEGSIRAALANSHQVRLLGRR